MKTVLATIVALSALLAAAPAQASSSFGDFASPSGGLYCIAGIDHGRDAVFCVRLSSAGSRSTFIRLSENGRAHVGTVSGDLDAYRSRVENGDAKTLRYDRWYSIRQGIPVDPLGNLTCRISRTSGITCRNIDGFGFTLSRTRARTLGGYVVRS